MGVYLCKFALKTHSTAFHSDSYNFFTKFYKKFFFPKLQSVSSGWVFVLLFVIWFCCVFGVLVLCFGLVGVFVGCFVFGVLVGVFIWLGFWLACLGHVD